MRKRAGFAVLFVLLLVTEILISMYAAGWVRNYLGDVLVIDMVDVKDFTWTNAPKGILDTWRG